eukprot:gene15780-biopygen2433
MQPWYTCPIRFRERTDRHPPLVRPHLVGVCCKVSSDIGSSGSGGRAGGAFDSGGEDSSAGIVRRRKPGGVAATPAGSAAPAAELLSGSRWRSPANPAGQHTSPSRACEECHPNIVRTVVMTGGLLSGSPGGRRHGPPAARPERLSFQRRRAHGADNRPTSSFPFHPPPWRQRLSAVPVHPPPWRQRLSAVPVHPPPWRQRLSARGMPDPPVAWRFVPRRAPPCSIPSTHDDRQLLCHGVLDAIPSGLCARRGG